MGRPRESPRGQEGSRGSGWRVMRGWRGGSRTDRHRSGSAGPNRALRAQAPGLRGARRRPPSSLRGAGKGKGSRGASWEICPDGGVACASGRAPQGPHHGQDGGAAGTRVRGGQPLGHLPGPAGPAGQQGAQPPRQPWRRGQRRGVTLKLLSLGPTPGVRPPGQRPYGLSPRGPCTSISGGPSPKPRSWGAAPQSSRGAWEPKHVAHTVPSTSRVLTHLPLTAAVFSSAFYSREHGAGEESPQSHMVGVGDNGLQPRAWGPSVCPDWTSGQAPVGTAWKGRGGDEGERDCVHQHMYQAHACGRMTWLRAG